jgi:hypothetical protein
MTAIAVADQWSSGGTALSARFWYSMYGLQVRSDLQLELPEIPIANRNARPHCVIIRADDTSVAPVPDGPLTAGLTCTAACHNGAYVTRVYRGSGGTWFWQESAGTCHVSQDARRVDVYPAPNADPQAIQLMLVGQVATFVLHKLGYPSLHASAVATDRGGIVFLGRPKDGKSTMAALFLRDGFPLLTDDVLPLEFRADGVYGVPSIPMMKVWPQTAEHTLQLSEPLPNLTSRIDKKFLAIDGRYQFATVPSRLTAIYVLNRYDPVSTGRTDVIVEPLTGQEAFKALLTQTSNRAFLLARESLELLPLYSRLAVHAPVSHLWYPSGFEHQPTVRSRILADVEAR